tara:strand:- start:3640 stop:3834 length:195 start_codon:yes stop_codon:yes gene_type:complete
MEQISLYCTDKDKYVTAGIVVESQNKIVTVVKPGDIRIELKLLKPGVFVGNLHGMEFVYDKNRG